VTDEVLYGQCAYCRGNLTADHDCPEKRAFDIRSKEIARLVVEAAKAPQKRKATYIGAPACFKLEQVCQHVADALVSFDSFGVYQVGSSLDRADWRDIDIRAILSDDGFKSLFPDANVDGVAWGWEQDPMWLLLTVSISAWMREQTGLPIDFQIQPQTHANERHKGSRNAVGIKIRRGRRAHTQEGQSK
jgi:hypothetical protein